MEGVEFVSRPWGSYQVYDKNNSHNNLDRSNYVVKKLIVNPGNRVSLQYHTHRTEHWFVVGGSGIATVNDTNIQVTSGSSIDVPCGAIHRLAADVNSEGPLVVIEVQTGDIISEDDICRISDDYGRISSS